MWTFGGSLTDENNQVIINSKETIEALKYGKELAATFIPGRRLLARPVSNNKAFLAGEISATGNGISVYYAAKNSQDAGVKAMAEDIYHARMPIGPVGKPTERALIVNPMIFTHTKYPNAAKEYLRFMMEEEQYLPWLTASSATGTTRSRPTTRRRSGPTTRSTRPTSTCCHDAHLGRLQGQRRRGLGRGAGRLRRGPDGGLGRRRARRRRRKRPPKPSAAPSATTSPDVGSRPPACRRRPRAHRLTGGGHGGDGRQVGAAPARARLARPSLDSQAVPDLPVPAAGAGHPAPVPDLSAGPGRLARLHRRHDRPPGQLRRAGELHLAVRRPRCSGSPVFNTLFYTILATIGKFALGLWLALLLNNHLPFKSLHPRDPAGALDRADRALGDRLLVDLRPAVLDHLLRRWSTCWADRPPTSISSARPGTRGCR